MKKVVGFVLMLALIFSGDFTSEASSRSLGNEVLSKNDGWASYGEGTTGGAKADKNQIYTVSTKRDLIQALGGNNATNGKNATSKIIYVKGKIELNVDLNNQPVGAEYYADPAYDFSGYLNAYDPMVWGYSEEVYGPFEEARARSQKKQKNEMVINIGSNTTIVGVGKDAKIKGGSLMLNNVENIIIRNIEFEAPVDFFPQWDPTDGEYGEWNSEYDNISIINGTHHVWIDHNTFSDGENTDKSFGTYFGRLYQKHDGLLDITNGSNYVTVSYNIFKDHDKVSLIGSSDSRISDRETLKVTLHHNHYQNLTQRLPRVRFGEVHVYNNFYEFQQNATYGFDYAIGVGQESKLYVQNNYFKFDFAIDPSKILKYWKGTSIYEDGSIVQVKKSAQRVDLIQAFNQANEVQFNEEVGWKPERYTNIHPTMTVPILVNLKAGSGKLF
ncbi:pectate lyase family protein [Peribacillus loiseleuriae]|uniref:Pectate lyase domain-containing protein n=1 Tax=Peribacillus loiseleuriae TaxID=1679170 RepID=A0A0K9GPL6_9BACI|nr:hypothetical protein [Peribacillus loiseleuriae]KMY48588.1 hypothetical protein AC625_02880 [Peribacillus loiseleuriae]